MNGPRAMPMLQSGRALCVLAFALAAVAMGHAQTSSTIERTYGYSQGNVQAAVRELRPSEGGRLPILDSFVLRSSVPLSQFERPYFQLEVEVVNVSAEQTLVRVSAKITAWYSDPDPSRSEYRTLKSNGHLENDFLDRLDDALKKKGPGIPEKPAPKASQGTSLKDEIVRVNPGVAMQSGAAADPPPDAAAAATSTSTSTSTSTVASTTRVPESLASLNDEVAELRSEREEIEQRRAELGKEIKRFEEITQNQVTLTDLVAVKVSGAAVRDRPADDGRILFRGEARDEYKLLEKRGDWIHVLLEGDTRAWVRSSEVTILASGEKPTEGGQKPAAVGGPSSEFAAEFTVVREEVKPFSGDWPALKGKQVLFVFAQPGSQIPEGTLGRRQLAYAKRAFVDGYGKATSSPEAFAGVVIVFLGAHGGVAAATVADIRQWAKGGITVAAFVQRCSFDPPEAFRDVQRH